MAVDESERNIMVEVAAAVEHRHRRRRRLLGCILFDDFIFIILGVSTAGSNYQQMPTCPIDLQGSRGKIRGRSAFVEVVVEVEQPRN